MSVFPEGFEEAVAKLLRILSESPNSYSVSIFRYEGQSEYQAKIELTYHTAIGGGEE